MKKSQGRGLLPENEKLKPRGCRLSDREMCLARKLFKAFDVHGLGRLVKKLIDKEIEE